MGQGKGPKQFKEGDQAGSQQHVPGTWATMAGPRLEMRLNQFPDGL